MNTPVYRILAIFFLGSALALPLLLYGFNSGELQSNSQSEVRFHCPPCGCDNDLIAFQNGGPCSVCRMEMVELNDGFKAELDQLISPMLKSSILGQFYTKLIYPVFAIGILFSLLMLILNIRGKSLNLYLIGIILAISLFGFKNQMFGVNYGLTSTYKSLFTPISFILLIGPLIYLYIKELTTGSFKWKRQNLVHFIPGMLMFTYYAVLMAMPEPVKLQFMFSPYEVYLSHTEQILSILAGFFYIFLSLKLFRKWQAAYSQSAGPMNSWIIRFITGMSSMFFIWSLFVFLNFWLYDFGVATVTYNPLWVWMGLILSWLGIEVMLNPKFFLINKPAGLTNGSRIINDLELTHYKLKLEEIMAKEKLYTNPELSLDMLASVMNINPRYLSTILNNALGKSFYDFINYYRIEEVKVLLKDPGNKNLTIEAIANLAGFKSKSSFNSAFKKYTSMTPREFIKHEMVA